jgi:hypothetical protein
MHTAAEYSKHAEECRKQAGLTADPQDKKSFEDIAQSWERLAELSKHDAETQSKSQTFLEMCSHLWTHLWSKKSP